MTASRDDLLERIFEHKRQEVTARKAATPSSEVERAARARPPAHDFIGALRGAPYRPALIAEIKRASPSRGPLAADLDAISLAEAYTRGGAAAISVLTDECFFRGSLGDLEAVAALNARPPLLRKDFICDPYQIYEARAAGSDAVLLIAAYLDSLLLCELHSLARELGMTALVEVHDEADLARALACAPSLIGINNRDLRTFEVHLDVTRRLAPEVPPGVAVVAESGIFTPDHVRDLAALCRGDGAPAVDAILVGEALVTAPDTEALAAALSSAGRPNPYRVPQVTDHRSASVRP
jgi:indole-3-glycerol phosphate synthase